MKVFHSICAVSSVALALLIGVQFPITKMSTERAVEIVNQYERRDLGVEDARLYDQARGWILFNQRVAWACVMNARLLGWTGCAILLAQSVVGLVAERRPRKAEQHDGPNRSPSEGSR